MVSNEGEKASRFTEIKPTRFTKGNRNININGINKRYKSINGIPITSNGLFGFDGLTI